MNRYKFLIEPKFAAAFHHDGQCMMLAIQEEEFCSFSLQAALLRRRWPSVVHVSAIQLQLQLRHAAVVVLLLLPWRPTLQFAAVFPQRAVFLPG